MKLTTCKFSLTLRSFLPSNEGGTFLYVIILIEHVYSVLSSNIVRSQK